MYIVYMLKNSIENKSYVGLTKNLNERLYKHGKGYEGHLVSKAVEKHGLNSFEAWIVDSCKTKQEGEILEKEWITKLGTMYPNGYNLRLGNSDWNDAVKKQIGLSNKGKIRSPETIQLYKDKKRPKMVPIKCVETGIVYESIKEASRVLGVSKGNFSYFFRGLTKSVKGFTFERIK